MVHCLFSDWRFYIKTNEEHNICEAPFKCDCLLILLQYLGSYTCLPLNGVPWIFYFFFCKITQSFYLFIFPTSMPKKGKTIWTELELYQGPLASQVTTLTTRPCHRGRDYLLMHRSFSPDASIAHLWKVPKFYWLKTNPTCKSFHKKLFENKSFGGHEAAIIWVNSSLGC